jgi:hypothetical protein
MSIPAALHQLLVSKSGDTVTFLMLAIGAEIQAWQEGARPEAEALSRIGELMRLSKSFQAGADAARH